jgi:hypothetical protein
MTNVLKLSRKTNYDSYVGFYLEDESDAVILQQADPKSPVIAVTKSLFEDWMGNRGNFAYEDYVEDRNGWIRPVVRHRIVDEYWNFVHPSSILIDLKKYLQTQ